MSDQAPQPSVNDRLRNDFASFTIPQYAALGLMVVAVVILGFWFVRWSTTPTWELVASGLTPSETTAASEDLTSAGIDHRLANGGTAIEVPSSSANDARVTIGEIGGGGGSATGYEILDEQGFLASSFRQQVDYQRAVEGELARTILSMQDVTSATVHLAIPQERIFSDEDEITRASVVVGGLLSQGTVASITNVVASAVPGLDPGNVTVADTGGRILSGGNDSGFTRDQQLQMQDLMQAQLELDAESMLAVALGPGHAVVRVTADLNFDELEQETVTYDPEAQVSIREQTIDEAFTGDNSVPLGTLGTAESVTDAGELAGEDGSAYIRQESNSEFGVPSTKTFSRQAPGSVERITVAVLVDDGLDPAPDPAAIEQLVAAAVGVDDTRGDSIVVQAMPFDELTEEEQAEAEAALAPAAAGGGLEPMIGYAKTGMAILGMLLALLFLRKGLKTLAPVGQREPVEIDPAKVAELTGGSSDDGDGSEAAAVLSDGPPPALTAGPSPDTLDPATTTVNMLDLIDSQSEEVALMLRDLVSESAS